MKHSTRILVGVLWFSVACGDSVRQNGAGGASRGDASADASPDAERDAQSLPDGSDTSDTCQDYEKKVTAFAAAHRSCATSEECVVVGNCSNAHFVAVSASSEQEATALVDGRPGECQAQDGPAYYPVCFEGVCQKLGSVSSCGGPPVNTSCPTGLAFHREGCSPQVPFAQGCYASCDPDAKNTCPAGSLCQQTTSNDCIAFGQHCTACGSSVSLCLPEPDCEVLLSVEFQRGARRVSVHSEVAEINLVAENRTDAAVSVDYLDWCHGPLLELGAYDLWNSCLAGLCTAEERHATLTLAARERRVVKTALASPLPSTCNPDGLAKGNYLLSFQLPGASGAKVCILPASELRAGESAAP